MCCLLDWPWSSMPFVSVRSKCPLVYIMATAQRFRLTPRVVGSFDQRAAPVTTPRIPLYADVARAIDTGLKFKKKCTNYFHEIFSWNWFHKKKLFQICHIFFCCSFHATLFFSIMNALVYVKIDQGIH